MIPLELVGSQGYDSYVVSFNQSVQRQIDHHCSLNDVAGLESMSVRLIARVNERPYREDCYLYLMSSYRDSLLGVMQSQAGLVLPRGYAIYYSRTEASPKVDMPHVGMVLENGLIRSKWGQGGHVFEHPVDVVPTIYGNQALISVIRRI